MQRIGTFSPENSLILSKYRLFPYKKGKNCAIFVLPLSRGGEIGRRAGLKIRYSRECEGSIPSPGITDRSR